MNLREIRPDLWLLEMIVPDFDVRGAVIVGRDRVLVWDTLTHPRDMEPVAQLAQGKPITVVYSHSDWDHCWGTAGLKYDLILAHEACAQRFKNGDVAKELAEKSAAEPGTFDAVKLCPPNLTFKGMVAIDLGDVTVELHYLPGHTDDCLVAFIPEWGVLLAGDTVELPLPYFSDDTGKWLDQWITQLEQWHNDTRVKMLIPSHGALEAPNQIGRNLTYLRDLVAGREPSVPAEMTAFYTETHARNREIAKAR
jgi:glyoxylase-like metal-dependent hydrolase (beta-lactamase superfamily II)